MMSVPVSEREDTAPKREILDNAAWKGARPRLSVLIPFHRHDPVPLLEALSAEAETHSTMEFVLLDDGSGDERLSSHVEDALLRLKTPARLITLPRNEGRAQGRNRLAVCSRARHLLFLDCDMRPLTGAFLRRHLDCVVDDAPVVIGGFAVEKRLRRPVDALHAALQRRGECISAKRRALHPEKYVYTSNLLVRRDVLEAAPFDPAFTGWGWEDVEWGMRVSQRFSIHHMDNPALHLGMDAPEVLVSKYEQSVANFARLAKRHPQRIRNYPSYRAAQAFKRLPMRGAWRRVLKSVALNPLLPLTPRVLAMKAYRAALYADAVP